MNNPARHRAWLEAPPLYEEELGRARPESCARVRDHDLKHTCRRRFRSAGVSLETRKAVRDTMLEAAEIR